MKCRIQRPINWVQYSVNEQEFETEGLTETQIQDNIRLAKRIWDLVQTEYSQPTSIADFQLISEFNELKKVLEKVQTTSEQKSVLLEAMKKALWESQYEIIKEETVQSKNFKKVTLHSNKE